MKKAYPVFFIRFGLLGLLMCCCCSLHAQKGQRFSNDSTQFIGALNSIFFNLTDNEKKIVAPVMEDFVQKWNQEQFSPSRKKIIYEICNEMVRKKIRPFPDFFNYIKALNVFINSHQPEGHFQPWSEMLKRLIIDKNSRKFLSFLESTMNLFGENLIYKSSSTLWKIATPDYYFFQDTVPVLFFSPSDLVCYANGDSLIIHSTKGKYYPLTNEWRGTGGHVDWSRAGADPQRVFADLENYIVQLRYSKFSADSVSFTHKSYFPHSILGKYTDKVQADVTEEKASYPRFTSYDKMIGISNLFPNIDYLGGFSLEGSRIIGLGDKALDARIFFKKDGKDFVIARSKAFIIRPDKINSSMASVTIYHDHDSIFHPGLQLKYINEKKELSFSKDERISTISPWFDSFHKIEIYCEALYYKVGEPKINFEMMLGPSKQSKAVFESSNYYSQHRYEKLQGIDEINPLNLIKQYCDKKKSQEITLDELTRFMNKPIEQVEGILLVLANRGFLVYDYEDKVAKIKDKLKNYVAARGAKADYDVIYFNSDVTNTSNGILNLETFDLKLQGVPVVVLSDSQIVHVYPKNAEIILKKDMDFVFSGKLEAGLFDFYVRDGSFEYNKFRINLPMVDSLLFYVKSKTWDPKTGTYPLVKVKTAITSLSGELLIDEPDNKSGLKAIVKYPIFTNRNNSMVFWNKGNIQKGVYKKENFFFEVQPFTINSLDVVATDSLHFTGALTSAGIFPKIEEPLKVRPDFSLGLETTTKPEGSPVYGGKGTFVSRIDLSDRGLRGDGTLTYLNSVSTSPDFVFLPDSMKTIARGVQMTEVVEPVEYPSVKGDSVKEFWLPYRDSLIVTSLRKDMAMYNDQSNFNGTLSLTPHALIGNGTVKIKDAEMDSKGFGFKRRTFDALIANFRIKSYDLADLTISTKNYQTHFDLDARKGEFKSNVGISKVEFPFNKYICSMDRFDWLIDSDEILLSNEQSKPNISDSLSLKQLIDVAYTGSEFISVHPKQDSLKFFAARATYNLRTNVINAREVKIVKVADAAIYPDSGKIMILKNAQMLPLHRAIIIANVKSRFHQFYNAEVEITSRKNYSGSADYDYVDRTEAHQPIHFSSIRVDSADQTVAQGTLVDSIKFHLSPEFGFKGNTTLFASERNLRFDGEFKTITDCLKYNPEWVKFTSTLDPQHLQIPVSNPVKNTLNETVNLGLMFYNTEETISPTFFKRKNSFSDSIMITTEGLIEYNVPTTEFRIASEAKLKDLGANGNFVSLNTTHCMIRGEGKLKLGLNSGNMKMESFGTLDYFIIPDSTRLHLTITLNFPFSDEAMQRFSAQLESVNLSGVNIMRTPFAMAMESLLEKQDFNRIKTEVELVGRVKKFPESLVRTLVLADIWMKWDTATHSYISYGPIGIGNIGKTQINRYVNGIVEFSKKKRDDDFTLYLQLTNDDWYFFNFRSNLMQAISSDLNFNDLITTAAKSRTEMNRVGKEARGYRYSISTDRKKRDFLRKFQTEETP
ncbi:MAG: hypothetical protein M0P47_06125 [Bacteroidales bacterium]|nr:hypothetical protein [Bacteroidales bacterium]